jgi:hypothetical protein
MNDTGFIGYVGSPAVHDGILLRVCVEGDSVEVVIQGYGGQEHVVLFEGVDSVEMKAPEGMVLYSISEMRATPPLRKFVFIKSEEDHPGCLSVWAKDFCILPKLEYPCPVCGYSDFDEPPWSSNGSPSYDICPSCGVEFAYQDFGRDEVERRNRWHDLRQKWIGSGMRWSSSVHPLPPDWNPVKQLKKIGIEIAG